MVSIIPAGTFYAEDPISESQVRAIALVHKLGEELAQNNPEIADIYRNKEKNLTAGGIAEMYLSDYDAYPNVCRNAVSYALRKLMPKEELSKIAHERRVRSIEDLFGGFDTKKFTEHCREAARIRHQTVGVDAAAMTRGRGFVPWTSEERQYVL